MPVLPLVTSQQDSTPAFPNNDLDNSRSRRWRKSQRPPSYRRGMTVACEEDIYENDFVQNVRLNVGLYMDYPLAQSLLEGEEIREGILRKNCKKQINHVKCTDGWIKSMFVLGVSNQSVMNTIRCTVGIIILTHVSLTTQPRAIDKYSVPLVICILNSILCTVLYEVAGIRFEGAGIRHWDEVYALVMKTALAFLLVFRLNRVAIRYWETRTMWGNVTLNCRALTSGILVHLKHAPALRDRAIQWVGAFPIACMHFIRNDQEIPSQELWGVLARPEIEKMLDSQHAPLYAATQIRRTLNRALRVTPSTLSSLAQARAVQMNLLEELINNLIAQVSGMERIRSTPLPIVYVTHLRTFLFIYLLTIPYIWISVWGWATILFCSFTAFALLGIEGASSECELPFDKTRANHLALDAYCLIILENIQGLVVQDANTDMEDKLNNMEDDYFGHRRLSSMEDHPLHRRTGSRDIASRIDEIIME